MVFVLVVFVVVLLQNEIEIDDKMMNVDNDDECDRQMYQTEHDEVDNQVNEELLKNEKTDSMISFLLFFS